MSETKAKLKLSERMKGVIARCKVCGGTGSYEDPNFNEPLACMKCCDWLTAIRQVKKLEDEVERLQEELKKVKQ